MQATRSKDLTGKKFNDVFVIGLDHRNERGGGIWLCKCKCGKELLVPTFKLSSNLIRSCGCRGHSFGHVIHGMSNTKIYTKWKAMLQRCYNENDPRYKDYGGRGIIVCESWHVFDNFYYDMKDGYSDDLQLDRVENDGGYEKSNCKWSTHLEQQQNKQNTVFLTLNGIQASSSKWSEISGTKRTTINSRYYNGWPHEECVYGRKIDQLN